MSRGLTFAQPPAGSGPAADRRDPSSRRARHIFGALALAVLGYSIMQSLVAPALPALQHRMHVSAGAVSWVLTAYLLSSAVLTLILGRVGDNVGRRKTLLWCIGVFALGTVVCTVAGSLPALLAGRVIQGTSGALFPLACGIVGDELPGRKAASALAVLSAMLGIGGGLGIVLAGPIVEGLGARALFWTSLPLIALAFVWVAVSVPESSGRIRSRLGWISPSLLTAWLACLLLAIGQGPEWGWSSLGVVGLLIAAVLGFLTWVRHEARAANPIVDISLMRVRNVWAANLASFGIGAAMYTTFLLIPQFVETDPVHGYGFGASVSQGGYFLLPLTVLMLPVSPLAARIQARVGARATIVFGATLDTAGFLMLALLHGSRVEVLITSAVFGIGIGIAFSSIAGVVVAAAPPSQMAIAAGTNAVTRTAGGLMGNAVAASLLVASTRPGGIAPDAHGYTYAFLAAALITAIGLAAAICIRPHRREAGLSARAQR